MKAALPILIFYQQAWLCIAFWCLRLVWVAGWLCNKPQVDP